MSKKKLGALRFSGSVHKLTAFVGETLVAELVSDKGWSVVSGKGKGFYGSLGKAKEGIAKVLLTESLAVAA
jgi:hypothetical protein